MEKDRFTAVIAVFLMVVIFIFLKVSQKPSQTTVIYTNGSGVSDDISTQNNKTNSSNKITNSSNKKDNSYGDEEKLVESSNILEFEDDMFDLNYGVSDELSDNIFEDDLTSSENSNNNNSNNDDSQSSSEESNVTYNDLLERIYYLKQKNVNVFINWHNDIVSDKYGIISDINLANKMLTFTEKMINTTPSNYFYNLQKQGYKTQILLASATEQDNTYIQTSINENKVITIVIKGDISLSSISFFEALYDINCNIISKSKIQLMYYEINKINPVDFTYGVYNDKYIIGKYFLNIESQKSANDDCKIIFANIYSGSISTGDYLKTPLENKINVVKKLFDEEVFY